MNPRVGVVKLTRRWPALWRGGQLVDTLKGWRKVEPLKLEGGDELQEGFAGCTPANQLDRKGKARITRRESGLNRGVDNIRRLRSQLLG
jgi:hypothetical protein